MVTADSFTYISTQSQNERNKRKREENQETNIFPVCVTVIFNQPKTPGRPGQS